MSSLKSDFYVWSDQEGNREHLREWTLGEFIAALRAGGSHYCMANRTKNTNLRDILAAETGELDCVPVAGTRHEVARREFFFGSESAGPGLHHDGAVESFLCQLIGAKRINVFLPRISRTCIPPLHGLRSPATSVPWPTRSKSIAARFRCSAWRRHIAANWNRAMSFTFRRTGITTRRLWGRP